MTAALGRKNEDEPNHETTSVATMVLTMMATESALVVDAAASGNCCEVCPVAPRERYALLSCGHAQFCVRCTIRVAELPNKSDVVYTPAFLMVSRFRSPRHTCISLKECSNYRISVAYIVNTAVRNNVISK